MPRSTAVRWFFAVVLAAGAVSAQTQQGLEKRIDDLERRVNVLERKLGLRPEASVAPISSPAPIIREPAGASGPVRTVSEARTGKPRGGLPISVRLVDKTLQEKGPGEESDQLGFSFEFANVGSEHLTSFAGEIVLRDMGGQELARFEFNIAKYLMVGQTTNWYSSIPFSAVNPVVRQLHTAQPYELRTELRLRQVMYYDTRVESFE